MGVNDGRVMASGGGGLQPKKPVPNLKFAVAFGFFRFFWSVFFVVLFRFFWSELQQEIPVSLLDLWQPLVWQHPTWFWCISRVTSM